MKSEKEVCALCAWRADCKKKFSVSGRDIRCADFARDMALKEEPQPQKKEEPDKKP